MLVCSPQRYRRQAACRAPRDAPADARLHKRHSHTVARLNSNGLHTQGNARVQLETEPHTPEKGRRLRLKYTIFLMAKSAPRGAASIRYEAAPSLHLSLATKILGAKLSTKLPSSLQSAPAFTPPLQPEASGDKEQNTRHSCRRSSRHNKYARVVSCTRNSRGPTAAIGPLPLARL